jgi:tetratricopeptide (TPR) repeat protein/TolB-like protein
MATVYLAEDLRLGRRVALKVLQPDLAATLGPERFLREIQIASRLTHPHILALHDSGEADRRLFYAMPYVEGESLRQRLSREGQLPIKDVLEIVRAVAGALTYAHQMGIVHRDIKPENILLARTTDGGPAHPLLADFGIARALDVAGGERLTETGLALGTPAYMSPEQATAGSRLDGRSDIYALGCVAYEMLAGSPPFTGQTAQAIMARHVVDRVPPLHTVRATVPPALEQAIEQALAKAPADRFETANQFADALVAERALKLPRHRDGRRTRLTVGALLVVAAGGIGGWTMLRHSSLPPVSPVAASMAVLPFVAATADTALVRLGRDLAVTISASLDGVGGIQTAERLSVATATADKPTLTAAEAAALAQRLGASGFVRGTLVRAGDKVRLDFGLYQVEGLAPLAEGITVSGHRDSIGALTDSATWALLRQVWQRGKPPSPSLADVATRSLPALRAFLEGEQDLAAGRWDQASLAFQSAVAADSTFGLAYFRYALARWWTWNPPDPPMLALLRRYRPSLSARERLLLDGFLTSETTPRLRIERYRAATERFPEYWPGWFLYADALYHGGPVIGYDWTEALKAFQRVVALNPKLVPAWEHLRDLALGRDQAVASQALTRLRELGWPFPQQQNYRMLSLTSRFDPGVSEAGGLIPPGLGVLADSLADYIVTSEASDEQFAFVFGPLGYLQQGFPAAQIDLNQRALKSPKASARLAGTLKAASAWAWVARGQWDSGFTIMSRVVRPDSITIGGGLIAQESYQMAVLGAWLGAISPDEADQRRTIAVSIMNRLAVAPDDDFGKIRMAWLDGLLGFARGDRQAIQRAQRVAASGKYYQSDLVVRSLGAFDLALSGNHKGAARELVRLEEYCIDHENCNSMLPHIAVQRLAAAQWLRESGDLEQAGRLLRWQDQPWVGRPWTVGDALSSPTFLLRAEIEEARGHTRLAQEYYQQFLRRYDRPVASQAHLVDGAKLALARLRENESVPAEPVR